MLPKWFAVGVLRSRALSLLLLGLPGCASAPAASPSAPAAAPAVPAAAARPTRVLAPERVAQALAPARDAIDACLDAAKFEGAVRLAWEVDASGNAGHFAFPELSSPRPELECLPRTVSKRLFHATQGTATASWVFVRSERANVQKARRAKRAHSRKRQGVSFGTPGRLSAAHVDDVVQSGYKLYAHCFREGIAHDLHLKGQLALRFQVQADGSVADVCDAGSDLGDARVVDCAAEAFYALAFERPKGGPVTVTYPILLNTD